MTMRGRCANLPLRVGMPLICVCLLGAVVLGPDMTFRPRRHLRGYIGHRDLKETGIQILGALLSGDTCWAIYHLILEARTSCFG